MSFQIYFSSGDGGPDEGQEGDGEDVYDPPAGRGQAQGEGSIK